MYEAAVSVLMRVVFLLFAEERALLPQHQMYRDSYAISGVRGDLEHRRRTAPKRPSTTPGRPGTAYSPPAPPSFPAPPSKTPACRRTAGRCSTRPASPGYGRPTRKDSSPFASPTGSCSKSSGPCRSPIVGGEARQLSFRDLDVEQIGYVYEGLLGYSAEYTQDVVVGLHGKSGYEPEIALTELRDDRRRRDERSRLRQETHRPSEQDPAQCETRHGTTDRQSLRGGRRNGCRADARTRLGYVLLGDTELVDQLAPLHALIRNDLRDFPYVVPAGGLVMTESPQRANTGTHYTPRSLAEEVVLHALEPLVYSPGPLDTENRDDWVLKSSTEILNLKVADIAVGSGAFLVAAARYLAARLIEARSKEGLTAAANEDAQALGDPRGRRPLPLRRRHQRHGRRNVQALSVARLDGSRQAVLLRRRPGLPRQLAARRHDRTAAPRPAHRPRATAESSRESSCNSTSTATSRRAAQLRRELASGQVDDADRMRSTRAKRTLLEESRESHREGCATSPTASSRRDSRRRQARDKRSRHATTSSPMRSMRPIPRTTPTAIGAGSDAILEAGLTPTVGHR